MKKTLKYAFLLSVLVSCVFLDCCLFELPFLSLLVCVCFSFYKNNNIAVLISAFCGLLCDLVLLTLPYFSCIYLYLSLGCVWCREMFLGVNFKRLFFLSFCAYLSFFVLYYIIKVMLYAQLFMPVKDVFGILIGSVTMSFLSPVIYFGFKRLGL